MNFEIAFAIFNTIACILYVMRTNRVIAAAKYKEDITPAMARYHLSGMVATFAWSNKYIAFLNYVIFGLFAFALYYFGWYYVLAVQLFGYPFVLRTQHRVAHAYRNF